MHGAGRWGGRGTGSPIFLPDNAPTTAGFERVINAGRYILRGRARKSPISSQKQGDKEDPRVTVRDIALKRKPQNLHIYHIL